MNNFPTEAQRLAASAVLVSHPNAQIWKVEDAGVSLVWFADKGEQWVQVVEDGRLVDTPHNVTALVKAREDWDTMQFHNWGARD